MCACAEVSTGARWKGENTAARVGEPELAEKGLLKAREFSNTVFQRLPPQGLSSPATTGTRREKGRVRG